MKTLTAASIFGLASMLALPASAQPYPTYDQPPAAQPQAQQPGSYDPNLDYDADIDGYDAEYDIRADDAAAANYDDGYDPNAYQQFEGTLDPYGQWVDDASYGHVWVPSQSVVGYDF